MHKLGCGLQESWEIVIGRPRAKPKARPHQAFFGKPARSPNLKAQKPGGIFCPFLAIFGRPIKNPKTRVLPLTHRQMGVIEDSVCFYQCMY